VFTIPTLAFTMSDPGVHVAPIPVFMFDRSGRSRSTGTRTEGEERALDAEAKVDRALDRLTTQPILGRAASTRRARVLGQALTPR
jgi:hypothetical protein